MASVLIAPHKISSTRLRAHQVHINIRQRKRDAK